MTFLEKLVFLCNVILYHFVKHFHLAAQLDLSRTVSYFCTRLICCYLERDKTSALDLAENRCVYVQHAIIKSYLFSEKHFLIKFYLC